MTETPEHSENPIVAELQMRLEQITTTPPDALPDLVLEDCLVIETDPLWLIDLKITALDTISDALKDHWETRHLAALGLIDAIEKIEGSAAVESFDKRDQVTTLEPGKLGKK